MDISIILIVAGIGLLVISAIGGWQQKRQEGTDTRNWTVEDWQKYNRHVQHTLDDYNKWKREYIQSKGVNPDEE